MAIYIQGLLFGMVLQFSIGPVSLAIFQRSIDKRLANALWMVPGVVAADGLCVVLALIGAASLLQVTAIKMVVGLGGALLIAWFGLDLLRSEGVREQAKSQDGSCWAHLRYGFILTIANPITIAFWGGVFATLVASEHLIGNELSVFAVGAVSSTAIFLPLTACFGRSLSPLLQTPRRLRWLNICVGLFLIGFAFKLAMELFH